MKTPRWVQEVRDWKEFRQIMKEAAEKEERKKGEKNA